MAYLDHICTYYILSCCPVEVPILAIQPTVRKVEENTTLLMYVVSCHEGELSSIFKIQSAVETRK